MGAMEGYACRAMGTLIYFTINKNEKFFISHFLRIASWVGAGLAITVISGKEIKISDVTTTD